MEDYDMIESTEELKDPKQQMKDKRGKILPVFLVLSWIGLGFSVILTFLTLRGPMTDEQLEEQENAIIESVYKSVPDETEAAEAIEDAIYTMRTFQENHWLILGLRSLAIVFGFFGLLYMYKLKKIGFFLYLVYCLIPVAGMLLIFGKSQSIMSLLFWYGIFTSAFIIVYAAQLKRMS